MKKKIFAVAMLAVLLLSLAAAPIASAAAANKTIVNRFWDLPVTGSGNNGETFKGTLDVNSFGVEVIDGVETLVAYGAVTGKVSDANGKRIGNVVDEPVVIPVSISARETASSNNSLRDGYALIQQSCPILDLELGPVDIDLLGLVIHLDRVDLEITAERGAGNLLGNLLCAVAGLLDGGPLAQIANLLNQILAILQGITI